MKKLLYILAGVMMVVISLGSTAIAEQTVEEKVDSLFIMASSLDIKFRDLVEPARDSIAALGTAAVPKLIDMLGTPHGRERAALEEIFKKIGRPAVPLLNDALLTTDSLRLSRVGTILFYLPDTSSVENLLKVADNPYYSARYQIIRALGKIGDPRAVPTVRTAMTDTIQLVRTIAAVSAGRLADPILFPDLVAAFEDTYYGVRMSAQEQLQLADCDAKVGFITNVLPTVSDNALKHLLTVIANDTCVYSMDIVTPYFDHPDPVVKSLAIKAAFRIDPDYVRDYISQTAIIDDSFILRQTIEELRGTDEAETPAKP